MVITVAGDKMKNQTEVKKRWGKRKLEDIKIEREVLLVWDDFFNELRTNTTDDNVAKIFITLNFMLILKTTKEKFVSYYENENLNLNFLYEEVNEYLYFKRFKIDLYENILTDYDLVVSKNSLEGYIKKFLEHLSDCEDIEKKFKLYVMRKFNSVMTNNIRASYSLINFIKMLLRGFDFKTIYDPAIGTGDIIGGVIENHGVSVIEGQDISEFEVNITKMNLVLNENVKDVKNIYVGNSIIKPMNILGNNLKKFDCIVCNPPFSGEWGANIIKDLDEYNRFYRGIPPKILPSFAYITHIVESLNEGGLAVVVVPLGVLFRDGSEESIRKQLISEGIIDTVIYLPQNMMEGSNIPINLLIINKAKKDRDIFIMDLTDSGKYEKGKSMFDDIFISEIASIYEGKTEVKDMSKMISYEEIMENNFNLYSKSFICKDDYVERYDFEDCAKEIMEIKEELAKLHKELFEIIMS